MNKLLLGCIATLMSAHVLASETSVKNSPLAPQDSEIRDAAILLLSLKQQNSEPLKSGKADKKQCLCTHCGKSFSNPRTLQDHVLLRKETLNRYKFLQPVEGGRIQCLLQGCGDIFLLRDAVKHGRSCQTKSIPARQWAITNRKKTLALKNAKKLSLNN